MSFDFDLGKRAVLENKYDFKFICYHITLNRKLRAWLVLKNYQYFLRVSFTVCTAKAFLACSQVSTH